MLQQQLVHAVLGSLLSVAATARSGDDPRTHYDVQAYRLELRVDPTQERIAGVCTVEARVVADELEFVQLDLDAALVVERVWLAEIPLEKIVDLASITVKFERDRDLINCHLPSKLKHGATFHLSISYSGAPHSKSDFDGFHWKKTAEGEPWIATSSQGTGSKYWWPCKDSFFHPEDKPERFELIATVPKGLYAVSNGRLNSRAVVGDAETFHWLHEYPLETYSVTLNVAPYVVVETKLQLAGIAEPVPFIYYVLPEAAAKAAVQFAEVPKLAEVFGDAFGPFPFPKSKLAFVHVPFWGMEHSSAIAYGSSFPAWIAGERARDPELKLKDKYGYRNADYDYILVHEFAHEWWGNAVSAADWGDFWLHEGFGNYAEGVWVERTQGRKAADAWWAKIERMVPKRGTLFRGDGVDSDTAYSTLIYSKGACVLHTLRTYVGDDEAWWKLLRDFNLAFRYRNATTADFQAVVERATGAEWQQFFDEWFRGDGYPVLSGTVTVSAGALEIAVANQGSSTSAFHVPLDLEWIENDVPVRRRVLLDPGDNRLRIETSRTARDVRLPTLASILGKLEVDVIHAK